MAHDDAPATPRSERRPYAYEELDEQAVRLLIGNRRETLARALLKLGRLEEEGDVTHEATRRHTEAIDKLTGAVESLKAEHDQLTAAVCVVAGLAGKIDERTATLCELLTVGLRDIRADVDAVQDTTEHVGTQALQRDAAITERLTIAEANAARVPELGARVGTIEGDLGEAPNEIANRPGSGIRGGFAILMRDLKQRTGSSALALGGGAIGGGAIVVAVLQLLKAILGSKGWLP